VAQPGALLRPLRNRDNLLPARLDLRFPRPDAVEYDLTYHIGDLSRGVTVNSGSNIPVTFTFSRSQHGSYTVYVNGVYAGSLTVEEAVEPDIILYVSVALILIALSAGSLFLLNRKRQGY